jgi:hypothetical protein
MLKFYNLLFRYIRENSPKMRNFCRKKIIDFWNEFNAQKFQQGAT